MATAEGAPLRRQAERVCRKVAEANNIKFDVISDDWEFLYKYGLRDEMGGIDLPQVFVELDDGTVKHVMTRLPLTDEGKIDIKAAEDLLLRAIRSSD